MPKYRQLTQEELLALEKEFVDYLIVNGIDAAEWTKIQTQQPQKAEDITTLFSDVVFEKILRQATYLRHQTEDSLHCFHYQKEEAVMLGIKSTSGKINLIEDIQALLKTGEYELITGKKTYQLSREEELFQMTMKGAELSDGAWYKKLALLL